MTRNHDHNAGERIARAIARAGLASRREAEAWIDAGRVAVNGKVITSPACDVTADDTVTVDGKPLPARERARLFLYHKPRGLLTTRSDPRGRPTIFERLPKHLPRLISVGRLDFNTEGLLLLTNDGALARTLELPSTGWLRRYRVRAHGAVTQAQLDALRAGITVSGIHYGAIDARLERVQGSNLWLSFAIREGKNREVRNVLAHLGLDVTRLIRVSFGPFQLGELKEGDVEEVRTRVLREQLGERLVAASGADFSAPIARRNAAEDRDQRPAVTLVKTARRTATTHAWRAREEEQPRKKLKRKYHGGSRGGEERAPRPTGAMRSEVVADRKGRRVAVERYGEPPAEQHRERIPARDSGKEGRHGRRHRRPDRAFGPRPSRPKPQPRQR